MRTRKPQTKNCIYLDFAATTPLPTRVKKVMERAQRIGFANTMSLHQLGRKAREMVEDSRRKIAREIGVKPFEVYFTSCATESNNWALKGTAEVKGKGHIVISSIEHPCVIESANWLCKQGFEVEFVNPTKEGWIEPKEVAKHVKKSTILVSVMTVNNETGVIQPVKEIVREVKRKNRNTLVHSDASQALGKIFFYPKAMGLDLATLSSHKCFGPKGAGALWIREGIKIAPLLHGGGHERGLRSGTLNGPAIVGFGEAVKLCYERFSDKVHKVKKLADILISGLERTQETRIVGNHKRKVPHINMFLVKDCSGESLVLEMDHRGFCISTGSACSSEKMEPSHVLLAMGISKKEAMSSVRISLSPYTTISEVRLFLKEFEKAIEKIKKLKI